MLVYACFINIYNTFFGYWWYFINKFSSFYFVTLSICRCLFFRVIPRRIRAIRTEGIEQLKCCAISDKYASGCADTKALKSSGGNFFGGLLRIFGDRDSFASTRRFHSFNVVVPMPNSFAVESCVWPLDKCSSTLSLNRLSYAMALFYHFLRLI